MPVRVNAAQARKLGLAPKAKRGSRKEQTEADRRAFLLACEAHGLPEPTPEYQFVRPRKWRADWLFWIRWDGPALFVEIQGGLFKQGRHNRGAALVKEYEKINEGSILGFRWLFITPAQVKDGSAFVLIRRALGMES